MGQSQTRLFIISLKGWDMKFHMIWRNSMCMYAANKNTIYTVAYTAQPGWVQVYHTLIHGIWKDAQCVCVCVYVWSHDTDMVMQTHEKAHFNSD